MHTWSNIKNGIICGDCYALIDIKTYLTCRTYCKSLGLECLNAFEAYSVNCKPYENGVDKIGCDTDFIHTRNTPDALCECKNATSDIGITVLDSNVWIIIDSNLPVCMLIIENCYCHLYLCRSTKLPKY